MLEKIEKVIEENLDINVGTILRLFFLLGLLCLEFAITKNFCNPEQQEILNAILPLGLTILVISFCLSITLCEILKTFLLALIDIFKKRKEKYENRN